MPEIYLPDSPPDFEHHPLCPLHEDNYCPGCEDKDCLHLQAHPNLPECKCNTIYDDLATDAAEARRDAQHE